jgi:DNA-binding transcriptional ArsR family regulator
VAAYRKADRVLDALGDPTRRAVVAELRRGPLSVGELAATLPVSRPAVSQHLRVLRRAGLVSSSPAGTRRIYALDPAGLTALRAYVEGFWTDALGEFARAVDTRPTKRRTP